MNSVSITGRLGRDPETRYTTDQKAVTKFVVAVNDGWGDRQKTNWLNVVTFGRTAENCEKYLHKGDTVGVSGRISTGSYENKDGRKVYTFDIIGESVDFLQTRRTQAAPDDIPAGYVAMEDDDIPF